MTIEEFIRGYVTEADHAPYESDAQRSEREADTTAALAELAALRAEVATAKSRAENATDWYQQRFNRLRRWVEEEVRPLSVDVAHRYYAIGANGSPSPHESSDWTVTMHGLRLRAEHAEGLLGKLRADLSGAKALALQLLPIADRARVGAMLVDDPNSDTTRMLREILEST